MEPGSTWIFHVMSARQTKINTSKTKSLESKKEKKVQPKKHKQNKEVPKVSALSRAFWRTFLKGPLSGALFWEGPLSGALLVALFSLVFFPPKKSTKNEQTKAKKE